MARLKDKVAPLHKRKLYLTYGMVLCLVTLTDLQMRRAGLSASAELLVLFQMCIFEYLLPVNLTNFHIVSCF